MGFVPAPDLLRDEEIIAFNLTSEWVWWDTEDGVTVGVIIMISSIFMVIGSPGVMVFVGVEWVHFIFPGFFEIFNGVDIVVHTHSDN